jgi:hypothetical protein
MLATILVILLAALMLGLAGWFLFELRVCNAPPFRGKDVDRMVWEWFVNLIKNSRADSAAKPRAPSAK